MFIGLDEGEKQGGGGGGKDGIDGGGLEVRGVAQGVENTTNWSFSADTGPPKITRGDSNQKGRG